MRDTKSLENVIADAEGFDKVMGPLLGALIRNSLKELLDLQTQINTYGFAVDTKNSEVYRHNKTENDYLILKADNVKIEATWSDAVLYLSADRTGPIIARDKMEFLDGRFTQIQETDSK